MSLYKSPHFDWLRHKSRPAPCLLQDSDLKQYWMPDSQCKECYDCNEKFTTFRRRHHCRLCGQIFCSRCCNQEIPGKFMGYTGEWGGGECRMGRGRGLRGQRGDSGYQGASWGGWRVQNGTWSWAAGTERALRVYSGVLCMACCRLASPAPPTPLLSAGDLRACTYCRKIALSYAHSADSGSIGEDLSVLSDSPCSLCVLEPSEPRTPLGGRKSSRNIFLEEDLAWQR